MTAVLIFSLGWCAVSVIAAAAWVSLKREERRDRRIKAERDAANARTWAHIVETSAADWKAWEVEVSSR